MLGKEGAKFRLSLYLFLFISAFLYSSPNPVIEYRLDECGYSGANGEVNDSVSAKNAKATAISSTSNGGILCKYVEFDGENGYIIAPDNDIFSPHAGAAGEMSLSAWIKISSYPVLLPGKQNRTPIVAKGTTNEWEYALYVYTDGSAGFTVWQPDGSGYAGPKGGIIPLNKWVHIAGSLKKGEYAKVYIDGVLVSQTLGAALAGDTKSGSSPFYIARRGDTVNSFFKGGIDEVRLYDKALSDAQINQIRGDTINGKNYDGTDRVCGGCALLSPSFFNAVEVGEDAANGKIYAKIAKKPFVLKLVALTKEKNIDHSFASGGDRTVRAQIVEEDAFGGCDGAVLGSGDITFLASDNGVKNVTFQMDAAKKRVRFRLFDAMEANASVSCSSDFFSVRPDRFESAGEPSFYAQLGENNLTASVRAKAFDGSDTIGYDATLDKNSILSFAFVPPTAVCESNSIGALIESLAIPFSNGVSSYIGAKFKDVGKMSLTLSDSVWTAGDECVAGSGSNVETGGLLGCDVTGELAATAKVYESYINSVLSVPKRKYKAYDIKDQNGSYGATLEARGKEGGVLKNFSNGCFSEDSNASFVFSIDEKSQILYKTYAAKTALEEKSVSVSVGEYAIPFALKKELFGAVDANGTVSFSVDIAVEKNGSNPTNPTKLTPKEIKGSIPTAFMATGYIYGGEFTYFLHAKLYIPSFLLEYAPSQIVRGYAQIYDSSANGYAKSEALGRSLDSASWWIDKLHTDAYGVIQKVLVKKSEKLDDNTTNKAGFEVKAIPSSPPFPISSENGIFNMQITMTENKDSKVFLHFDTPPYLSANPYSFAPDSDCSGHVCGAINIFSTISSETWGGDGERSLRAIKKLPKSKRVQKIEW